MLPEISLKSMLIVSIFNFQAILFMYLKTARLFSLSKCHGNYGEIWRTLSITNCLKEILISIIKWNLSLNGMMLMREFIFFFKESYLGFLLYSNFLTCKVANHTEHLQPEIFFRIFQLIFPVIHWEQQFYSKFLVDNALEEGGKLATLSMLQIDFFISSVEFRQIYFLCSGRWHKVAMRPGKAGKDKEFQKILMFWAIFMPILKPKFWLSCYTYRNIKWSFFFFFLSL